MAIIQWQSLQWAYPCAPVGYSRRECHHRLSSATISMNRNRVSDDRHPQGHGEELQDRREHGGGIIYEN